MGVGAKAAAKAPINTLIAAWQEQAVPVKDMLGALVQLGVKVSHGQMHGQSLAYG